jgi:hypothetical protein
MTTEFKFADSVWHRVVQIVQESMLLGVDCADLLRQICVMPDEHQGNILVLSPAYEKQVRDMHTKMLTQAREIEAAQHDNKFIIQGRSGDDN